MSQVVVDTDVVSFFFKKDRRASAYHRHLVGREAIISFMTLAELRLWARVRNWNATRTARLEQHVRRFGIYPYDAALCQTWADITHGARRKGHPIATADAWIAATAVLHQLPLVTHNASDYRGVEGLTIITEADM